MTLLLGVLAFTLMCMATVLVVAAGFVGLVHLTDKRPAVFVTVILLGGLWGAYYLGLL